MESSDKILKELEQAVKSIKVKAKTCNLTGIGEDVTNFNDNLKSLTKALTMRFGSTLTEQQETEMRNLIIEYELVFEDIESKCLCVDRSKMGRRI